MITRAPKRLLVASSKVIDRPRENLRNFFQRRRRPGVSRAFVV
jgi:microcompartment protein CcmL/EutN